jgi:3-oxoacyl-[acyl-carrier protein] reductase
VSAQGLLSGQAARLGELGADVACLDVADPKGAAGNVSLTGAKALPVQADLAEEHAVARAIEEVLSWAGRVDVLVNMAGLYYGVPRVPFWEIDLTTWEAVVASNLRTAFLCCRAVSGPMRSAGRGRIVNVSSNVSVFGMANFMHYVSAKAALVGMTRAMARELGPFGVAVNAVAPGLVRTKGTTGELRPEYWESVVAGQCLREPIEVADVVEAVAFLSTSQSRMITGQTLLINGGASMGPF